MLDYLKTNIIIVIFSSVQRHRAGETQSKEKDKYLKNYELVVMLTL